MRALAVGRRRARGPVPVEPFPSRVSFASGCILAAASAIPSEAASQGAAQASSLGLRSVARKTPSMADNRRRGSGACRYACPRALLPAWQYSGRLLDCRVWPVMPAA